METNTSENRQQRKKKSRIGLIIVILAVLLLLGGFFLYLLDDQKAGEKAVKSLEEPQSGVRVEGKDGRPIVFVPENQEKTEKALIFYPGGKVEYQAYAPLAEELAKRGILCILVPMPMNMALFDIDAAEKIREEYPSIREWYIGGHSLGGSAAAMNMKDHAGAYDGIVFLASYTTEDLSGTDLRALSVYGDRDTVLNRERYEENFVRFPKDLTETVIRGGNHAGFGDYGKQDGDGEADISPEEQRKQAAELIAEWIFE